MLHSLQAELQRYSTAVAIVCEYHAACSGLSCDITAAHVADVLPQLLTELTEATGKSKKKAHGTAALTADSANNSANSPSNGTSNANTPALSTKRLGKKARQERVREQTLLPSKSGERQRGLHPAATTNWCRH